MTRLPTAKLRKAARPQHPFPYLMKGMSPPYKTMLPKSSTTAEKNIINLLRSGARVLFDIKAKKGLIYTCRRGIETVMEITARMLSALLQHGDVVAVSREGRLVHYALAGTDVSWYKPE